MEQILAKFKETADALLADVNGRAEEVKENFDSFKTVFGKELNVQTENLKTYKERLETKGKKLFNSEDFVADLREEVEFAIKDVKSNADRFFDFVKENVSKAK